MATGLGARVRKDIRENLVAEGYAPLRADEVVEAVSSGSLTEVLVLLLPVPPKERSAGPAQVGPVAVWLAGQPGLKGKVRAREIQQPLAAIVGKRSLAGVLNDQGVQRLLLRRTLEYAAEKSGVTADPAGIEQALNLIDEGLLAQDLRGLTRSTARTLRRLPKALLRTLQVPSRSLQVRRDVLLGIAGLPKPLRRLGANRLRKLMRGDADGIQGSEHLAILDHTLDAILAEELPPDVVRDWLVDLLDYDSVRLAIVLYARLASNLTVADADIDALQASLRNNDLTPLAMRLLGQAGR